MKQGGNFFFPFSYSSLSVVAACGTTEQVEPEESRKKERWPFGIVNAMSLVGVMVFLIFLFASTVEAQSRRVPPPTPTPTPKDDDTIRVDTEEIKLNITAFSADGDFVPDVTE